MKNKVLKAIVQMQTAAARAKEKLREKTGTAFLENGLVAVIAVVVAAILIVAVIAIFRNIIIPNTEGRINDFFAMA